VQAITQGRCRGESISQPRNHAELASDGRGRSESEQLQNATRSSLAVGRRSRMILAIARGRPPGLPLLPLRKRPLLSRAGTRPVPAVSSGVMLLRFQCVFAARGARWRLSRASCAAALLFVERENCSIGTFRSSRRVCPAPVACAQACARSSFILRTAYHCRSTFLSTPRRSTSAKSIGVAHPPGLRAGALSTVLRFDESGSPPADRVHSTSSRLPRERAHCAAHGEIRGAPPCPCPSTLGRSWRRSRSTSTNDSR
jgi:hypothetical protein